MKKFLLTLSLLLSATTIPLLSGVYTYTPNQNTTVQIGSFPSFDMTGMVMQTILYSPNFEEERANIRTFLGIPANGVINQTYQTIVAKIHNAPSDLPGLYETIEALEKALIHYVHRQNYVIAFENKWLNIFASGIRWSWINPIRWVQPSYWYSDNSSALQVCMQELLNLAAVAERHSSIISYRMRAKAESYLHWRKNLSIAIATYLTANLATRGWQKSSLKMLKNGGLSNTGKILEQSGKDIYDLTNYAYNTTSKLYGKGNGYLAPITNIILYGDQKTDTLSQNNESSKKNKETTIASFKTTGTEKIKSNSIGVQTENNQYFNHSETSSIHKENKKTARIVTTETTELDTAQNKSLYYHWQNFNKKLYKNLTNNSFTNELVDTSKKDAFSVQDFRNEKLKEIKENYKKIKEQMKDLYR